MSPLYRPDDEMWKRHIATYTCVQRKSECELAVEDSASPPAA
jgi:hypothetical protein